MSVEVWDDRDNTVLEYVGQWARENSWKAGETGERGSLATTNAPNDTLTFTFPYPGIGVSLWGMTRRSTGGLYRACVDCSLDDPDERWTRIDGFDPTDQGGDPPGILFSRQFTTPETHKVILQNLFDDRGTPKGNSMLGFDRVELQTVASAPNPSLPLATTSPSPAATSAQFASSPSTSLSAGGMAGIVIGSTVVAILLVIIGMLLWRVRRTNRAPPLASMLTNDDEAYRNREITPYKYNTNPQHPPSLPQSMIISSSVKSKRRPENGSLSTNRMGTRTPSETPLNIHPASLFGGGLDSSNSSSMTGTNTVREKDGGRVVLPLGYGERTP